MMRVGDHRAVVNRDVVLGAEIIGPVTRHGMLETARRREIVDIERSSVLVACRKDLAPVSDDHIGIQLDLVLDARLAVEAIVTNFRSNGHLLLGLIISAGNPRLHDVEAHAESASEAIGRFIDHQHILASLASFLHSETGTEAAANEEDVGVVDRVGHRCGHRLVLSARLGHLGRVLRRAAGQHAARQRRRARSQAAQLEKRAPVHAARRVLPLLASHPSFSFRSGSDRPKNTEETEAWQKLRR